MAGLVIDCTNLYRSRVKLQKCADAAALAGVGYTIQFGRNDLITAADDAGYASTDANRIKKLIQTRADQVLSENVLRSNLVKKPCPIVDGESRCAVYDPVAKRVAVDVKADVKLLLLDLFPFRMLGLSSVASLIEVNAGASAERPVANVGLILDMSGSMSCPVDAADDCSCRTAGTCTGTLKVDRLIDGLIAFVDHFDPQSDEFSVVPFNTVAMVVPGEFGNLATELLDRDKIACILNGRGIAGCSVGALAQPMGNTNVCDAFMKTFGDMYTRGVVDQQEIAYLFFSDGAPDAMRALYNDAAALPDNSSDFPNTKDYTHYSVEWVPTDGTPKRQASSLMIRTGRIRFGYAYPQAPYTTIPGKNVPLCHNFLNRDSLNPDKSAGPGAKEQVYPPQEQGPLSNSCKVFEGCLSPVGTPPDLGFYLPFSNTKVNPGFLCNPNNPDSWKQQYYDCALAMADEMRAKRGTFFVVGLGADNPVQDEPYQTIDDTLHRKDIFLSRIANDFMHSVTQRQEDGADPVPEFNFTIKPATASAPIPFPSYADLNASGNARRGEYVSTPSADQLRALFQRMAKRILLKLVR